MEIRVPQHLGPFSPSGWPGQVYGREGRCGPQPVQGGGWVSVSGPAASFQSPRAERERAERRQLPVPSELRSEECDQLLDTSDHSSLREWPVTETGQRWDLRGERPASEMSAPSGSGSPQPALKVSRGIMVSASGQGELWGHSWAIWGYSTTLQSALTIHWGL